MEDVLIRLITAALAFLRSVVLMRCFARSPWAVGNQSLLVIPRLTMSQSDGKSLHLAAAVRAFIRVMRINLSEPEELISDYTVV